MSAATDSWAWLSGLLQFRARSAAEARARRLQRQTGERWTTCWCSDSTRWRVVLDDGQEQA